MLGTKGLKLLTRLRLNFSHLNEHSFRHGFKDTVDPMCECGLEIETTLHFLLCCRLYSTIRTELLDDRYTVASSLTNYPDEKLLSILLNGSEYFSVKTNQSILKSTIKFLKSSELQNIIIVLVANICFSLFYPLYVQDLLKEKDDL